MTHTTTSSHGAHRGVGTSRPLRRVVGVFTTAAVAFASILTLGSLDAASASAIVVAQDDFTATRATGWADAAVGGAYAYSTTRGVSASPAGGTISLNRAGEDRVVSLPAVSAADVTLSTTSRLSVRPTAGSGVRYAIRVRQSGARSYDALVRVLPTGGTLLSLGRVDANGVRTRLTADTTLASVSGPGAVLDLTLSASGSGPVALTADATLTDGTRKSTRSLSVTDASAQRLTTAGNVGVWAYLSTDTPAAAVTVTSLKATATPVVMPNKAPTAAFGTTTSRKSLEAAFDATASSDADGSVASYAWSFGDGSTATGASTTRRYARAGTYTATLTVTDDRGATAKTTRSVTVTAPNAAPAATFTAAQRGLVLTADARGSSDTDGTVRGFAWDFGDGTTGQGAQATHAYADGGSFVVTLTVTDDDGATATTTRTVTSVAPNKAPTAAFAATTQRKGLLATFDASTSTDADGSVRSYRWVFGDGTSATGVTASRTYARPGAYVATLTVTDDKGATGTTSRTVTVAGPNVTPTADLAVDQDDLDVTLDASGSRDADGTIDRVTWAFGDGATDTGTRTAHHYAKGGRYVVTVTVTDDDGAVATASRPLVVTDPPPPNQGPVAAFTASERDLSASFDASSSSDADGTVDGWSWSFGDGTTGSGRAVDHVYRAAGTYQVELTVTDDDGAVDVVRRSVTVVAPNAVPIAAFVSTQAGLTSRFDGGVSTDVDGELAGFAWGFGDGTTGTGATPSHTYGTAGSYDVTLTVTDDRGATDNVTRTVTVAAPAPPAPPAAPAGGKPSAATTGIPAGIKLARHDGDLVITKPGTVVDALDVHGFINVKAANVTIKRTRVRGGDVRTNTGLITNYGYPGLVIEDSYIEPDVASVYQDGIKGWEYTARRVHVVGGVDSAKVQGDNVRIEDSLLENTTYFASDPYQGGGATHNDNVQIQKGRNIVIRGNTIRGSQNFAILGAASIGDTPNLVVAGNWVDDGHCTVKLEQFKSYDLTATVTNNRFGPNRKVKSCVLLATPTTNMTASGNVWESNGADVPILRKAN
ncbi:MAG: PKD domain-containing protein [Nocardioidaceae bacterium]|nr:PKD domain-containing protein [Nocardioidaceae bacterium]